MVLTGTEIKRQVQKGNIILQPFLDKMVNPNSYNYRLGNTLLEIVDKVIDIKVKQQIKKIKIPTSGYTLYPGHIYLGVTYEKIGSSKYVPSLIGRSSLGRVGLFLQITADLGHIGTNHKWTLELKCVQPLIIYPKMRIGQVSFWVPDGLEYLSKMNKEYVGSYSNFEVPQLSIVNKFFPEN